MKKYSLLIFLVIIILSLSVNIVNTQANIVPNIMFMGLKDGDVVQIELTNWDVKYYLTEKSRYYFVSDMKFFNCCNKLVFVVSSDTENRIGTIDIKKEKIQYIDPIQVGVHKNIIEVFLSSKEPNSIYLSTNNKLEYLIGDNEEEIRKWEEAMVYARYDVEKDICTKTFTPAENERIFFPHGKSHIDRDKKKLSIVGLLRKESILLENEKSKNILYIGEQYSVIISRGKLHIVDIGQQSGSPKIIKTSPEDFGKKDNNLLIPDYINSVEIVNIQ
ncbi:MAG: hypothetical protein HQK79_03755 [Desulfobacterales bacterium]|nr:hypothetical protein [Desulfobacterales bacterium]MBF0396753.1 hypothetical protein [Desulfobacterales bacterium]